jgi:hypothetical protein
MESFSVIRASAFRMLKPWLFDKVIPLELIAAFKQKYHFVKPDQPDTVAANAPVDFQAGKFEYGSRIIGIEQFFVAYVSNRGTSLGVSTRVSSDASEAFLEHAIQWAANEYGLDTTEMFPRAYFSQVEFVLPKPLSQHFAELQQIGKAITAFGQRYGSNKCPLYEFGGFSMHFDVVKFFDLMPTPQPFAIERRVGATYDENKYFSQAPLRTQDHQAVLEQVEQILLR